MNEKPKKNKKKLNLGWQDIHRPKVELFKSDSFPIKEEEKKLWDKEPTNRNEEKRIWEITVKDEIPKRIPCEPAKPIEKKCSSWTAEVKDSKLVQHIQKVGTPKLTLKEAREQGSNIYWHNKGVWAVVPDFDTKKYKYDEVMIDGVLMTLANIYTDLTDSAELVLEPCLERLALGPDFEENKYIILKELEFLRNSMTYMQEAITRIEGLVDSGSGKLTPSKGVGGHSRPYEGASNDWLTPPYILDALGPFDLDPCACKDQPWKTATNQYTEGSLELPWKGRVWLNPPYGPHTVHWMKRLATHGDGIALIFARTETKMFFEYVWSKADAVLFLAGRLHFYRPTGIRAAFNSGAPSVLIAYGEYNVDVLESCKLDGMFLRIEKKYDTSQ